jgi:hypothetical protein
MRPASATTPAAAACHSENASGAGSAPARTPSACVNRNEADCPPDRRHQCSHFHRAAHGAGAGAARVANRARAPGRSREPPSRPRDRVRYPARAAAVRILSSAVWKVQRMPQKRRTIGSTALATPAAVAFWYLRVSACASAQPPAAADALLRLGLGRPRPRPAADRAGAGPRTGLIPPSRHRIGRTRVHCPSAAPGGRDFGVVAGRVKAGWSRGTLQEAPGFSFCTRG